MFGLNEQFRALPSKSNQNEEIVLLCSPLQMIEKKTNFIATGKLEWLQSQRNFGFQNCN